MIASRRAWLSALPLAVLGALVLIISIVQYRWLGEIESAGRERLGRDLRVATLAAAAAVELEVSRLSLALEAVEPDSQAMESVLAGWAEAHPGLGGLVAAAGREVGGRTLWFRRPGGGAVLGPVAGASPAPVRLDSAFVADSLLPFLASTIAASAEVRVIAALSRRDSAGGETIVARTDPLPSGPPDVVTQLLRPVRSPRVLFVREGAILSPDTANSFSWSALDDGAAPAGGATSGFELRTWHAAGSLEAAAASIRRRNLTIAFGLLALLTAIGAATLLAFRRNQRLAEDRATVLAGISHEIRTPLAVIRSAADNLRSGVVDDAARVASYGAVIDAQSERLARTVENAVAFARSADRSRRARDRIDLAAVVAAVVADLGQPGRLALDVRGPVWCHGDSEALAMAVRNLVTNALEYSSVDSAVVVAAGGEAGSVAVSVSDRGAGIDPAESASIFDPFARGRAGRESRQGGLGLGLALADRVAVLHGGRLVAAARPGGGTTFTLTVPAAE